MNSVRFTRRWHKQTFYHACRCMRCLTDGDRKYSNILRRKVKDEQEQTSAALRPLNVFFKGGYICIWTVGTCVVPNNHATTCPLRDSFTDSTLCHVDVYIWQSKDKPVTSLECLLGLTARYQAANKPCVTAPCNHLFTWHQRRATVLTTGSELQQPFDSFLLYLISPLPSRSRLPLLYFFIFMAF